MDASSGRDVGVDRGHPSVIGDAVLDTFVALTGSAVRGSALVDLFLLLSERAVAVLPVEACGVLVHDVGGHLRALGSSSASATLLDLFQIQNDEGPCLECLRSGEAISVDSRGAQERWPRFAALLAAEGHTAVHAFPMRSGSATLGALNLFASDVLVAEDREVAQALADLAALVLLRADVIEDADLVARRLEQVVQARATVAQAIGMLAERFDVDPDEALRRLRSAVSRGSGTIVDVAKDVVERAPGLPASLAGPDCA